MSGTQSHLHNHHSLDIVAEMVATTTSTKVEKVVGVIGTEAGLSNNGSEMVRLPNRYSADKLPTFLSRPSVSNDHLMRRLSRRRGYIPLACNASSHSPMPL